MSAEYFKKRAGTTDRGKDYEDLFISSMVLDFITDDQIQDFKISSNDESFGAFDDIVLEITWTDHKRAKEFYALQLKHSTRPLTLKNLIGKTGDFSIKKYHENFVKLKQSAYKWVILTNRKFNYNERESEITLEGDEFSVKILKYEAEEHFMKFCEKRSFFQFRSIVEDQNDLYKDFFEKFFLCTNQLDVFQVETATINKFKTFFSCDEKIFRDYYKFITDWSLREGKKLKLSKDLMKQVVAIQLLSPFVKTIAADTIANDKKPKCQLLLEAISKFHVSYFEDNDFQLLQMLLGDVVYRFKNHKEALKDVSMAGLKYQVITSGLKDLISLDEEKCNLLLWLVNYGPLVLTQSTTVFKAIDLCPNQNFVVLGQPKSKHLSFRCLSDLSDDLRKRISREFKSTFQGKAEITLEEIEEVVTTSQLLQVVDDSLIIGGKKETLPIPFIRRSLNRLIVDYKFLAFADATTVIIVLGPKRILEKHISNISIASLDELRITKSSTKCVYICDDCSEEIFSEIFNKYNTCKCHEFRITRDEKLEWIRSKGSVTDLKKFLLEDYILEESKLVDFEDDNSINLICADAGMGKTTLMKNLKNNYSEKFWTILIYPKDHSKYFRENGDDVNKFLDYILKRLNLNEFDRKVLEIFYRKKRLNFFWDALDETSEENLKTILRIIEQLQNQGYKQWITSRNNLETILESKFCILSRTIRQFDDEEQKNYIKEKLACCGENLEEIFEKINRNIQLFRYNQILGIPLQIYMFTELLLANLTKYKELLDKIFTLTDLYECFVDEKFNVLHQEKENFDGWNDMIYKRNKKFKQERVEQYEMIAIKLHFPQLEINCDKFLQEMKVEDSVGIITGVSEDNIANFWHNSYGEYFAALYLSKNLDVLKKLIGVVFGAKYSNVRFFFDLIMAKDHPAHVSVLYKNLDALRNCEESEIELKDKIGRSPLQLACTWGEQFPDLYPEKVSKLMFFDVKYRVNGIFANSVKEESLEYRSILEELSEKNNPFERDELFGFNSVTFADRARCLVPLEVLSRNCRLSFNTLDSFKDVASVLFYACVFDLPSLLDSIGHLPVVEDEFEASVVFTAVKHGSVKSLTKLVSYDHYHTVMQNNKDELLKSAFENKCDKVANFLLECNDFDSLCLNNLLLSHASSDNNLLQILVNNRADVNFANEEGNTPLFLACLHQKYENALFLVTKGAKVQQNALLRCCGESPEITRLLAENGANVNLANEDGKTAIVHACERSFFETAKVLIEYGANVNDANYLGCRPIHYACIHGRSDVVQKLIDAGADVNVQNKFHFVPLHYACGQQRLEVVELLVKEGARVDIRDGDGETALDHAIAKGHERIIEILTSRQSKET